MDVAVPVPLRQTFSYKIPPEINPATINVGYRVLVPFRAKLRYGITMTAAYQAPPKKGYRFLATYDNSRRLLAPEIQELLGWLVRYYRGCIGEAVKLVLPPGLLSEKEVAFKLTQAGETHARETEESRILALLLNKVLSKKAWETKAQCKIPFSDIRAWEAAGLLEMTARGQERESIPHVTAIELTEMGKVAVLEPLKRAPKQQQLLHWMQHADGQRWTSKQIERALEGGSRAINALIEKGFCGKVRVPSHEMDAENQDFEPDEIKHLTTEQADVLEAVVGALDQGSFQAHLLFGVTGSGKTEVYLRAIQHCLTQGRQALFLVPEIALTPLMERRIVDRFGERLAILHSAVGAGRRSESWARILAGKVDVVLGARSGIFAPLPRLGLVIVDEEHDGSYKQNDGIRYHARDLALVRAQMAGASVVLGSATPSLESWHNGERGLSKLLVMKKRATRAPLPKVTITDMREEFKIQRGRPMLSRALAEGIETTLAAGHQVMVLLNRRGYHSFLLCRKCGESVSCSQCEVNLTYHQTDRTLKCHYCSETRPVPQACPACGSPAGMMQFFGEGTQQVQEHLAQRFPDSTVDRLDRDRLTNRNDHQKILAAFGDGEVDILVGTQMIAKGHDFHNVTLVGIINADMGLRRPDFRCAETTFQLITQVAGRSGRGEEPGSVVIQTYMPEHYSITRAAEHDFLGFLKKEIRYRQHLFYSPFAHLVSILVTHEDQARANRTIYWMAEQLERLKTPKNFVVLGPARAPIGRIKGAFRYQIVLKAEKRAALHGLADAVVEEVVKRDMLPRQAIILDIDPYQFF